jgi:uncharacterized membrane protein (UPF0127 family)
MFSMDRHRLAKAACTLVAALTVAACGSAASPAGPADGTSSPTPSVVAPSSMPTVDDPDPDDWARLEEIYQLMDDLGPSLWAGWGEGHPPLLLESETADFLVGHPAPPDGFATVPGLTVAGEPVATRAGHLVPGIGVQLIGDRLGVALLPRDRLQAFIDEILGAGVVALDDVQYVRWAAHEAFHVFEMTSMGGEPPSFGFDGNEMETAGVLAETEGFAEHLADEAMLLKRALETQTDADLRAAVDAFLDAREQRRASLPAEVGGFELAVEWSEGLARYTDVRLLQSAAADYRPAAAFAALGASYPEPDTTWADAIHWLDDLSSVPGTVRDRYYELGAAQAYLLDRLMPGWHARALPDGESLESLLRTGLTAAGAGTPVSLRALAAVDLAVADHEYRVAVADDPEAWTRGLSGVDDLGPLDGLLFAFPEPVEARFFMKGASMPLDIAFFDPAATCVQIVTMPLCSADPCPTYGPRSPYRWAIEAPAGTLAGLAEGDRLTPPAR